MDNEDIKYINKIEAPINRALILVCEKCGQKLTDSTSKEDNPSFKLQQQLKQEINVNRNPKELRAVLTSCLSVCPKESITVGILATDNATQANQFFTIPKNNLNEKLTQFIFNQADAEAIEK
ncbi:thioredoxin domain-containing protein [Rickettsiales endosymbiont of Stachyamoeba lipophora]|uniref:hypothetical protein n=1 Tax=Rickettsiales endosymbiont of Stachyamoeba lipophora TaxID=2486578 RepID=UPI000F6536FE|nr:hypothetical protein [Rickettsiales endosymbiont of Stachyamoeba lipophora]AZL15152.1 hypothetical protein EF513_01065 [Rickettsiales endosymbiont of Stachyamoeba lipophora]